MTETESKSQNERRKRLNSYTFSNVATCSWDKKHFQTELNLELPLYICSYSFSPGKFENNNKPFIVCFNYDS